MVMETKLMDHGINQVISVYIICYTSFKWFSKFSKKKKKMFLNYCENKIITVDLSWDSLGQYQWTQ